MAKNRKHQSAGVRFGSVLLTLLLCLLIGGSGIGFVWQKAQIYELGQQIRKRELHLTELRDGNKKLRDQLAMLRSPGKLIDSKGEAAETEVWIDFATAFNYINQETQKYFIDKYDEIGRMFNGIITQPEKFCI